MLQGSRKRVCTQKEARHQGQESQIQANSWQTPDVRGKIFHSRSIVLSFDVRDQLRSRYCVGMWRRERLVAVSGADSQKWAAAEDLPGMPESDQSDSKRTDRKRREAGRPGNELSHAYR